MRKAFSLVELMIVVFIIAVLSVGGGIALNSRLSASRLETAAQGMATDLAYARSAALFKGCHTRLIFCADARCLTRAEEVVDGMIGDDGEPARFYAILRRAHYDAARINEGCYFEGTDPSPAADGYYDNWDFDKRPQELPRGIGVTAIYVTPGGQAFLSNADWALANGTLIPNRSFFFHANPNVPNSINAIVGENAMPDNLGRALMQIQPDDCDPAAADEDCTAYIISITTSGETRVTQCEPGTRAGETRICY